MVSSSSFLGRVMRYLFLLLFLNACTLPPAIQALSMIKTTYDVARIANDEKSLNDMVISEIMEKDCKTRNIIDGKEYCEDRELNKKSKSMSKNSLKKKEENKI